MVAYDGESFKTHKQRAFERAFELLRAGWTRGAYARDAKGNSNVHECSSGAVSFCAIGALRRATLDTLNGYGDELAWSLQIADRFVKQIEFKLGCSLVEFNDQALEVEEVITLLEREVLACPT